MQDKMIWFVAGVALIGIICLYVLHRNRSPERKDFDLTDLVMQKGRLDKFAFWFAVWNSSMVIVVFYMVHQKTMTEGMMGVILTAMVAPLVAKVIWGRLPGSTETTVHTERTVSSTEKKEP